jgi:type IV fimbrial biogenesis protein FimT
MSRLPCPLECAAYRQRGFTLIELLITLAVLGVIIAMGVVPLIRGALQRHRVEGIQAELLTDLRRAQSEAAQRSATAVAVSFGGNAELSCYTVHLQEPDMNCDCTRPVGSACTPAAAAPEIKSMQFARSGGVTVSAASASTGIARVVFSARGQAAPDDLMIDVQGTAQGQLRTSVSGLGVPRVCSPDGSIPRVASC